VFSGVISGFLAYVVGFPHVGIFLCFVMSHDFGFIFLVGFGFN
jgi:hypothetical protein